MYPRPILLKFLPNILKFSLPGLDASDARKTMLALGLFSQILSWLPLRTFYVAADINELPPPYLTLIKSTEKCQNFYDRASYQVEWDSLGSYTKEWALMLVEKIFLLLETQDSHVKGAKESPLASSIAQCVGYLFQALPLPSSLCKDDREMREAVENKLIEYFAKSTPLNAVKVCAKIMDSLVFTNPKILERILKILLNDDVLQATLGGEKLAFRLRLAGGACREAQADNISALYDSLILPVLSSALLNNHSEKVVRKALMKFLKDVLKGATSAYPLTILPEYEETDGKVKVICGPNFFENSKVRICFQSLC